MDARRTLADDVLDLLAAGPRRPGELALELDRDRSQVSKVLRDLTTAGRLETIAAPVAQSADRRGRWYALSTTRPRPAASPDLHALLAHHRSAVQRCAARHRAGNVRVFGSVARGDNHADSDVDLLVDFEPGASVFDQARLEQALEALLGVDVDVVSSAALRERDRTIRAEATPL